MKLPWHESPFWKTPAGVGLQVGGAVGVIGLLIWSVQKNGAATTAATAVSLLTESKRLK